MRAGWVCCARQSACVPTMRSMCGHVNFRHAFRPGISIPCCFRPGTRAQRQSRPAHQRRGGSFHICIRHYHCMVLGPHVGLQHMAGRGQQPPPQLRCELRSNARSTLEHSLHQGRHDGEVRLLCCTELPFAPARACRWRSRARRCTAPPHLQDNTTKAAIHQSAS